MIARGLIASIIIIALMAGISIYGFNTIPADAVLPVHWGLNGEVDRFAPRDAALVTLPGIAVFVVLVFVLAPLVDPRRDNVLASSGLLLAAWIGTLVLIAIIHGAMVFAASRGLDLDTRIVAGAVGALLIVLGNFMAKSRSSWLIGFRTPWTMSSEHAWSVANRAAGWLLVATGAATVAAAAFTDPRTTFLVLLAGVLSVVVVGAVISYAAWRADPDRAR